MQADVCHASNGLPACLPARLPASPPCLQGGEPPALPPVDRPSCLRCQNAMHFIGHVESDVFSDDIDEQAVYLFYCDECRIQCCLDR